MPLNTPFQRTSSHRGLKSRGQESNKSRISYFSSQHLPINRYFIYLRLFYLHLTLSRSRQDEYMILYFFPSFSRILQSIITLISNILGLKFIKTSGFYLCSSKQLFFVCSLPCWSVINVSDEKINSGKDELGYLQIQELPTMPEQKISQDGLPQREMSLLRILLPRMRRRIMRDCPSTWRQSRKIRGYQF